MSGSIDIVAEYKAAIAAVTDRFRRRFSELGLIAPANRIGLAGVARVVERRDGLYEPDPAGLMAVLLPIWDGPISDARVVVEAPDRLIDLVAWRPAADAPLMTRLGQAQLLGRASRAMRSTEAADRARAAWLAWFARWAPAAAPLDIQPGAEGTA